MPSPLPVLVAEGLTVLLSSGGDRVTDEALAQPSPVELTVLDGVGHIELNRPDAFNALDLPLSAALYDRIRAADEDPQVKVVLLSGRGRAFCAGGDVRYMAAAEDRTQALAELADAAHQAIRALAEIAKPVIAVVHGSVAGGGLGLTCSADLVLAGESTKFVAAYAGIAVTPDCSSTWGLPRIIGERRAMELVLLNKPLSAAQALDWGLVNRLHPDDEVLAQAQALAVTLAAGPAAAALGVSRRLIRDSAHRTLAEQLEAESASIAYHAGTPECAALIEAFVSR
ncbi:MAG: enoyl-CoA hydratase/isomerase family protein [Nocardioidaceae bacterium]|nr:MAG: enoyl-CoA hydratase/isomerase family protein [Nocardioidaceae bacterium]